MGGGGSGCAASGWEGRRGTASLLWPESHLSSPADDKMIPLVNYGTKCMRWSHYAPAACLHLRAPCLCGAGAHLLHLSPALLRCHPVPSQHGFPDGRGCRSGVAGAHGEAAAVHMLPPACAACPSPRLLQHCPGQSTLGRALCWPRPWPLQVMSALDTFIQKVRWAPLDVLVIDMPPGARRRG